MLSGHDMSIWEACRSPNGMSSSAYFASFARCNCRYTHFSVPSVIRAFSNTSYGLFFNCPFNQKVSTAHQYIVLFLFVSRALSFTKPFDLRVIGEPAFPRSLQSVYINYTCGTNLDKLYVQFCAKICPTFYYWVVKFFSEWNHCYLILKRTHLGYSRACLLKYLKSKIFKEEHSL